jgi:hypothetical protein
MKLFPCRWLSLLNIAHLVYPGQSGLLQVRLDSLMFMVQREKNLARFGHIASDGMDGGHVEVGVSKQPMPRAFIDKIPFL